MLRNRPVNSHEAGPMNFSSAIDEMWPNPVVSWLPGDHQLFISNLSGKYQAAVLVLLTDVQHLDSRLP